MSSESPREHHELLAAVQQASVRLGSANGFYNDAIAAKLGLNRTDVDCMNILFLEGAVTPGRLADVTGLTTGGITGILGRLEKAGLVRREVDPADRRRVIVRVSPSEGRRLAALFGPLQEALDRLSGERTDAELTVLLEHTERSLAIMQEETARLRVESAGQALSPEGGGFSAPLGSIQEGLLEFAGGMRSVRVSGAEMSDLFRSVFEGGDVGVTTRDGHVTFRSRWRPFSGRSGGEVTLNSAIPWAVRVHGGAQRITADLSGIRLVSVGLSGGMTHTEVRLGPVQGTVPVRISGGVSHITVTRPSMVPIRLRVRGGISSLRLDREDVRSSSAVDTSTAGYDNATGRYDISVSGGMHRLTVGTWG